jgi:hypothetical protein
LSTVGFGDYHPRSSQERLYAAMMLMSGVACFSYIMGKFIEILGTFELLNASFDDGDNLSKFFGLLQKFNYGKPINHELKNRIEDYFDLKW